MAAARDALRRFAGQLERSRLPVPIESLARSLGYQVIPLYTVAQEFSGLVSLRQQLIGTNGNHHHHRQRFSIAHELAHILLKHPPESHCTGKQIALYNSEADECAAELLMPQRLLARSLAQTHNVSVLAGIFDVSEEAMMRKIMNMSNEQ
jgi:Zn-dependent peptidase ImmA (M78 family)